MKYVFTLCIALFLFAGCEPVDTPPLPTPDCGIENSDDCCPKVAGRYHYRGRTRRFFGRIA